MAMVGGWLSIIRNQINGTYFVQKYPNCTIPNAYDLAKVHFGDGICYGGALNTLGCEFEGGDCINFNLAFPLCKGENRTNVQKNVGNGKCDPMFMNAECDYDGGDCCPYDVINNPPFGDGQCDAKFNTEKCGYDNGDCNDFRLSYPDCPFDDLSQSVRANDVVIGDGLCNGELYSIEECGYEFGDCNLGQVGQTVLITDEVETGGGLYFNKALSFDGTTMALGLYVTNKEGNIDRETPGLVKVWRFDNSLKMWLQLGGNIVGDSDQGSIFGYIVVLSSEGNRIAVSSSSELKVFQYKKNVRG